MPTRFAAEVAPANRIRPARGVVTRDPWPLGQWTESEGDLSRYFVLSSRAMPR